MQSYDKDKFKQMFEFWKKMFKCKILTFKLISVLSGTHFQMFLKEM